MQQNCMPLFKGRKVEIGKFDASLQLVSAVTGKKDNGGVRLDSLYFAGLARTAGGVAQEGDVIELWRGWAAGDASFGSHGCTFPRSCGIEARLTGIKQV